MCSKESLGGDGLAMDCAPRTVTTRIVPCVPLFYVNDIGSTGSRGRTWGFPVHTRRLHSDAGYAVLPLALLGRGAPVNLNIGEALG